MNAKIKAPGPLHLRLRQATQESHLRVERHPLLAPLLRPDLDRASYCRVLHVFRNFYLACEPGLDSPASSTGFSYTDYQYVPRSGLLAEDLRDLGEEVPALPPGAPCQPARQTPDQTLGWLYVLEGATQGGRLIGPKVSRALGLSETFGARYFHLYTRNQWRSFQTLLDQRQQTCDQPRVVDGALAAFEHLAVLLDAWSTGEGPDRARLHQ